MCDRLRHFGFGLLLCLLPAAGCDRGAGEPELFSGATMGTTYHIKVRRPAGLSVSHEGIAQGIEEILSRIDAQMSTWRQDSELSRFNASTTAEWFPVCADLVTVIDEALRISRVSGGAFDVTVSPLVELWGFGAQMRERQVPDAAAIAATMGRVGYVFLHTRAAPPALRKDNPGLQVDLSAIAPGFAVDRIADYLLARGLRDYVVELGGEVRANGHRPDGRPWRIAIEKPSENGQAVQEIVALESQGLSTSGDYRDYFEQDGRRYSHTIDPAMGRPIEHKLASVSVIAPTTMTADAMSTALMVLGPERGLEFARREHLPALFVTRAGDGFSTTHTDEFASFRAR